MNKHLRLLIIVLVSQIFILNVRAQTFKDPVSYLNFINEQHRQIMKDYLSYTSAVAHGKSARKVDNRRKTLLETVSASQKKIAAMGGYNGDKSLKDSTASFLKLTYHVLNDDYGKIVNMEEVAEQSYDAMEAYLLAQDIADQKLKEADGRLEETTKKFAEKNNINLVTGNSDELTKKFETAAAVNRYYHTIYLIFFKSYKQELYLMEAVNSKNINGIEQNKNTLKSFSEEGVEKLLKVKPYGNDNTLIVACRQVLEFYKTECEKTNIYSDYFLKAENFEKAKKTFESKKESTRTQADVEQYNKAVNEINKANNDYNTVNNNLNANRTKVLDNWNKAVSNFLDKHVPKYK